MNISFNWLKQYAEIDQSPEKVCEWLTDCGLEVEGLEKIESVKGGLKGVVIAEVKKCVKHPDADKLSLCEVFTGKETLPVVCGATNVAVGQKVLLATVGTQLYTPSGESFEIKKAKIRGQVSEGMICAEDELGLGTSHDGIMVLPPDAETGTPAAEYFQIEEDYLIEIGLTPNRIDAASHLGVARDLYAVVKHLHPEIPVKLQKPDVSAFANDDESGNITIEIEDAEACPRYTGLTVSGVKVEESPAWLKNRLLSIGMKPINNIVDITNFVLHECGQPLHAFDAKHIAGNRIIVKKVPEGTPFVTLDEEEIKLSANDLMICNASEPMCMAGILGGITSGVTESTTDIFLESAYFNPTSIRKSSKNHGIKTDSSFRFERGADPEMTLIALKRAAMLIKETAGGKITSQPMDVYPVKQTPCTITFNYENAYRLIGAEIEKDTIKSILKNLDIEILEDNKDSLLLQLPLYRVDVTREADVVEEILRIYGYNNIVLPERMHTSIVSAPVPDKEKMQNMASDMLSASGFVEIMNNSLTKDTYYKYDFFDKESLVPILNPLSQDLNVMRQSLFFGGMQTLVWNQNRRISDIKVYEFGNVYAKVPKSDRENPLKLNGYDESRMLAILMSGHRKGESWYAPVQKLTLFDLKAQVILLFKKLNIDVSKLQLEEIHDQTYFSSGIRYTLNGKPIAELGEVHSRFLKDFDYKQEVMYAEIKWDYVLKLCTRNPIRFSEIPKFPEVRRDLALLINTDVSFNRIEELAYKTEKKLLTGVSLFDIYRDDEKTGKDKKSYAVSFVLQNENKTLTDKEIDKVMDKIAKTMEKELGAVIR